MSFDPPHAIQCLKEQGRTSVWLISLPDGTKQVLKQWPMTPWFVIKLLLGITQPQRQCRGTRRLIKAGVLTSNLPRMSCVRHGFSLRMTLKMNYIQGTPCLDLLQEDAIDDSKARHLGRSLGNAVQRISDAGFFNRDIKLSNIVIGQGQQPDVFIIDPVGIRHSRNKEVERDRMIERIGCELVGTSIRVPKSGWMPLIRAALRSESPAFRRAVLARLRIRRES
ncbi:MAG: hypothetical protein P8J86_11530 [Phycisphaerales bacterium]|nr:hypothetical protein [Phycisphaerales bacterium]